MNVFRNMAHDAGYSGDEAEQVARIFEEEERAKAEARAQEDAEDDDMRQAAVQIFGEEMVSALALPDIDGILIADSTGESMTLTPDEARSLATVKLPAALAALKKARERGGTKC